MTEQGNGVGKDASSHTMSHVHPEPGEARVREATICVVGLGYIGLPTASLLASRGFEVHGVDVNETVVDTINGGGIHIREPELDVMVRTGVDSGRLRAHLEPVEAEIFILAVPTPFKDDYEPDLSYVEAATRAVAPKIKRGDLVILESTSPVGTTEKISQWLSEERPDLADGTDEASRNGCPGLLVAHCPERVLPGQIMRELIENDRIVGGVDDESTRAAVEFYKTFVSGEILATDSRTAEMSKLAENTFRDVNIAFANELSLLADRFGINPWELIRVANHHPRVNILQPGAGVGGHCIAVDPWFIVSAAPDLAKLTHAARLVNDSKPEYVIEKVRERARGLRRIACLGIAFKPNVDDLRESPALAIVERLAQELDAELMVVEPNIDRLPPSLAGQDRVRLVDLDLACREAELMVGLVRHRDFVKSEALASCAGDWVDFVNIWNR